MMQIELLKPCGLPWQPHSFQKRSIKFLLEHQCAALFLDPGLGKTAITLAALKILKKKQMFHKALIIAPVRVCHSVWPREIEKWADFNGLTITVLHGTTKDEALLADTDIHIINPEGLDWLLQPVKTKTLGGKKTHVTVDVKAFKKLGYDILIVDELSRFKHIGTNRFKAIKEVLHTFNRRWGLTGSPAANGLLDLFGQCYVLDMGRSFGPFVTRFRARYFVPKVTKTDKDDEGNVLKKVTFGWRAREGTEEEIYERLAPLALRISDSELDMPILIHNNIMLDLPDDAREIYEELEDELIAAINNRLVVASNAGVVSVKLRQVASGGVYYAPEQEENGLFRKAKREWANIHEEKVNALHDLVDELQRSPLLVAYEFEHDVDRLRRAFPDGVFVCDYSAKKFTDIEQAWNNGDIELMFGHPQSIGFGLNLQDCGHHVCWHSPTWNFELYDQFNRRVYRQGNKSKKVFVHHLLMRHTIDELIMYALHRKDKGQQALFDALVQLAKSKNKRKKTITCYN